MSQSLDIEALLRRLADELAAHLERHAIEAPLMVGIHTGGVWIAERLAPLMNLGPELGTLNINFYRDDFTRIGMHPRVSPSELPFEIADRHIVLVDDVLYTGRTIRAALNEIFDYGRPASVTLGVLVERSGREIPIQADAVGERLDLASDEYVELKGPDPLTLEVRAR